MTLRRREQASSYSDVDYMPQSDAPSDVEVDRNHNPVKSFFLPNSWLSQFLSVPSQIFFAIAGLFGMAHYARNIIRIRPKQSGLISIRGNGGSETLSEWIEENVPSLSGSFKPSWWLPKLVTSELPIPSSEADKQWALTDHLLGHR